MSNHNVVLRLRKFIKSKSWYLVEDFIRELYEDRAFYKQNKFYWLRKKKYGLRKKHFVPYESHRKRGVEYLPF